MYDGDASNSGCLLSSHDMVYIYGGLAQLARALAWHARGHRFDSDILHLVILPRDDMDL